MEILVVPIMFAAIFVQVLAGFGSGLIAMPLLIAVVGLDQAAPAFALVAQINGLLMILRYRTALRFNEVWRMLLAALIAIPAGVWLAGTLDERLVLAVLGVFTLVYALYSLSGMRVPDVKNDRLGYIFGFLSGLLHGAYNVGGPPLVIYGTSRRWPPMTFKCNLQTLFFSIGILVVTTHFFAGHYTAPVMGHIMLMVPATLAASLTGFALDGRIKPALFRRGVLVLLVILGLTMIF